MRSDRYKEYMKNATKLRDTVRVAFLLGGMVGILVYKCLTML